MWIELIRSLTTECVFRPPATRSVISEAEKQLRHDLPTSLKNLLLETNGVFYEYSQLDIIWSIETISRENQRYRNDPNFAESYMTFDCFLFFAGAGVDGILFAFPVTADRSVRDREIFAWYPLEDSRPVVAFSLKDYLTRMIVGGLTL